MTLSSLWASWVNVWTSQAPKPLGKLEQRVMECVWTHGELSVREMHAEHLPGLAYTTLMTTLDRLYRKGLLHRRKVGRAFLYMSRLSREQFGQAMAQQLMADLLRSAEPGNAAVLSSFVDAVSQRDSELLAELEQMVRNKRRGLRRPE